MRRLARLALAVGLALGGASVPAPGQAVPVPDRFLPATSAADDCLRQGKVWLVVVSESGGRLYSGCVGNPSTGKEALNAGPGATGGQMICSIGGYGSCPRPKVYADPYWSYWHAKPSGSYTYSTKGATLYTPQPGSIEGWCYTPAGSSSEQQSTCRRNLTNALNPGSVSLAEPTQAPTTTKPTPKPTTKPTSQPTTKPTQRPTTRPTSTTRPTQRTTRPTTKPTATSTTRPSASTPRPSTVSTTPRSVSPQPSTPRPTASSVTPSTPAPSVSSATTPSSTPPSSPSATDTPPVARVVDGQGTPWGTIAAGSAVGLGAMSTAGWVWWRRRQQ